MAIDEDRPQHQGAIAGLKHGDGGDGGDGGDAANRPKCATGANILTLPAELQLAISNLLVYPDALSLKHTNRTFYGLVDTGVVLKIDWLVSRRKLHLACPNDRGCDLRSDLQFCRGSFALLMKQRREHIECDCRPGIGCLVYGTPTCSHRQRSPGRWRSRIHIKITIERWGILLALLPALLVWLWTAVSK